MTVSQTTRFGLYRWSSDSDAFTRSQADDSHKNVEVYLAKMLSGTSVPTTGLSSYARTIFLNRANNRIYYYTTEDSSGEWVYIETDVILSTIAEAKGDLIVASAPNTWTILPVGTVNQILTVLDNSSNVGWSSILSQKGDLLTLEGTSTINVPVGTNGQVLRANSAARGGIQWSQIQTLSIADAAVTTPKIANLSVTTEKIVDGAVTTPKFADNSVATNKFGASSVTTDKFADSSVIEQKVFNSAVTEPKFAAASVTTSKIQDSAVTTDKIISLAVTEPKIANLAVTEIKIADSAVTTSKMAASSVIESVLASDAVTELKIAEQNVTANKFASSSVTTPKIANNSVSTIKIADGAVGSPQLNDLAVTTSKFGIGEVISTKFADNAITEAKIADLNITNPKIGQQAVVSSKFGVGSVTNSRIRVFPSTSILGNHQSITANPSSIVASADNTVLRRSGNILSFSQIPTSGFADGAVVSEGILNGTLVDADVNAFAAIGLTKLGTGPLPTYIKTGTPNYIDSSITVPKLNATANTEGVGVWLDYDPSVYFWSYNHTGNDLFPPRNLFWRIPMVPFPGLLMPKTRNGVDVYILQYSKYMRINNLCLVMVKFKLNLGNVPEVDSVLTRNGHLAFSLPFAPVTPNLQVVGSSIFTNRDVSFNQASTIPIIMSNHVAFVAKTGRSEPYSEDIFTSNSYPDSYRLLSTFIESRDIVSFSIAYEVAQA